jgi:hypothetical protein
MINRTATAFCAASILAMLAATTWRIAISPDWVYGPHGAPLSPRHLLGLFTCPACAAFVGGVLLARTLLIQATMDAARQWKQWGSHVLIGYAVICTLFHFYLFTRSLGIAGPFSPMAIARAAFVLAGSFLILVCNQMPKLPWLQSRYQVLPLDPARGARLMSFAGRLLVLTGLVVVVGAFVMPLRLMAPLIFSMSTASFIVVIVRKFQLRREDMHERNDSGS